jgi:hypothetical protein
MTDTGHVEVFRDDRGALLPVSLASAPFPVKRVFVVTDSVGQPVRGNHLVPCRQLLILVSGSVSVSVGEDDSSVVVSRLDTVGETLFLEPGTFVRYTLSNEHSTVLVLAEDEFTATDETEPET